MGEKQTDWSCSVCPLVLNRALMPMTYSAIQKRIVLDRGENRWSKRVQENFRRGKCFWNSAHLFYLRFTASLCLLLFTNVKWKLVEYSGKPAASLKKPQMCHVCRWGLLEDNAQGGKWLTYVGLQLYSWVCLNFSVLVLSLMESAHIIWFPEVFLNI